MWWVLLLSVLLPVTALPGVAALSTLGLEADQVQLKKAVRLAVSLVLAFAPHGYGSEFRSAHQTCAG